ncbi:MAG: SGNH/GDSL hydrolase family protein [Clostridia bacterium]|nr:SGNH/GDSL hydrolase family protein [Clostridia bacterium]
MKVKEKLYYDRKALEAEGPINIVVLGDSVSHGSIVDSNDYETVYWNLLRQKLNALHNYMPVNMICASIGGTTAKDAVKRLDKQVLKHEPDLVIVCFGLNDVNGTLDDYVGALRTIFSRCLCAGCEVILLTPNMLNTYVAEDTPKQWWDYAHKTAEMQNGGKMDAFMDAARALATELGVPVCDCYAAWKELAKTEDTTMMLANRINHPTPEMHRLFADRLFDLIIGEAAEGVAQSSTMFEK